MLLSGSYKKGSLLLTESRAAPFYRVACCAAHRHMRRLPFEIKKAGNNEKLPELANLSESNVDGKGSALEQQSLERALLICIS